MGLIATMCLAGAGTGGWVSSYPDHAWLGAFSSLIGLMLVGLLKLRDLQHVRRERGLEEAVGLRTEELRHERAREKSRSRILEMIAANAALGEILDGVVRLIRDCSPDVSCAIVLYRQDRAVVAAESGVPPDWISALGAPHAIPFEARKQECRVDAPAADPAWRVFTSGIRSAPPAAIHAYPVGSADRCLAVLVVFGRPAPVCGEQALVCAAGLTKIAIEHNRLYEDLRFRACHDDLTGLPKRALFEERLNLALIEARKLERNLALIYIDLDRFKQINDSMSHRIGDLFLHTAASRMRDMLRPGDTAARVGGDEFNILLNNVCQGEAEEFGARLLASIRRPLHIEDRTVACRASAGIAFFPGDGATAEELQRAADAAMYCAKNLGRDRVQVFAAKNDSLDRARLEQDLRAALREGSFAIHYQPKIDAEGNFGGLEALLRLNHPVNGQIPPAKFISVAEETGLIVPIGAWVLDEVCRQIAAWSAQGMGDLPVAVNVSPVQIACDDFSTEVESCLRRHGVSPFSLELELTESVLVGGGEETQRQMQRLRAIGITFSIDDFGTGYSSLSYLHRLKVDAIKLDRSFVQSIETDDAARRLVQAMICVAKGLGLNVIAEGVETDAQRSILISSGCPMMQGYLFSLPQAPAALAGYLAEVRSGPSDLSRIGRAVARQAAPEASELRAAV